MSDTNHPAGTRFSGRRWVMPNLLPLGFGIVLVLWVASSYDFTRRLEDVEQRTTAITGRFVQSERLLSSIQVQLLLGSLYLRDAIADTPTTDDYYRQQLQASRAQIDTALQDYKPMLDSPEEQRVFGTLRGEIADFWSLVAEVPDHTRDPLVHGSPGRTPPTRDPQARRHPEGPRAGTNAPSRRLRRATH